MPNVLRAQFEMFTLFRWIDQKFFKTMMFGGGSRVCIGRNLALFEVMLILSALLSSFSIERQSGDLDVKENIGFSNRPSLMPLSFRYHN